MRMGESEIELVSVCGRVDKDIRERESEWE
jgi:hypothetical protein